MSAWDDVTGVNSTAGSLMLDPCAIYVLKCLQTLHVTS